MMSKKDKISVQEAKKRINEQIEETKKLDLGLDADGSSAKNQEKRSPFDGFINLIDQPHLDDK